MSIPIYNILGRRKYLLEQSGFSVNDGHVNGMVVVIVGLSLARVGELSI